MGFVKLILGLIFGLPVILFCAYIAWACIMQIWASPVGKLLIIGLAITFILAFLWGLMPGTMRKAGRMFAAWKITIPFFFVGGFIVGMVREFRDIAATKNT